MEKRIPKLICFTSRVLRDFFLHNHGLLLTAAMANNMMLSLIPLSAVLLVVFSHFIDPAQLVESISIEVSLIAPGFTPVLTEVLTGFLEKRELIGWVGLGTLLVFSSFAFRVLADAMAIIFHRPLAPLKRKFWVSALMPYFFILVVAAGLIAITTINAVIDARSLKGLGFVGIDLLLHRNLGTIIYVTGVLGLVLLFTLFYKMMPIARIPWKRAVIGGVAATILWEIVRHLLVSYYTTLSPVNVIYGSMATIIIVLLTMEAVALILLLGAQIIADLHASSKAGIPWHEEPANGSAEFTPPKAADPPEP
jgi:YihY family inner membrane protein